MTKVKEVYKCEICGNIVEVLDSGVGVLVCCGEPMKLLKEQKEDKGNEKHVPIIKELNNSVKVIVGEVAHPMEEEHYIKWIEVITKDRVIRKVLKPNNKPEAIFNINIKDIIKVREYCSIHKLWSN